ncbi:AfsR/SARP family transcriptional regulator [Streptomyces termitum]|uniref:AfsR/SARP family transcriptional regulator n=1 Tax=Streptomyces termitum TaxID=67368 RepID=UPI0033B8896E
MVLRFGLLGPLVVHDGAEPLPVTGRKTRILLAALLLRANETVPKDVLKAALWEDRPPTSAEASLANHLTRLRRCLAAAPGGAGRLRTLADGYRLDVADGELDAEVFDTEVRAARAAYGRRDWETVLRHATAALALWRGAPLADLGPFAEGEGALRAHQLGEDRLQLLEWRYEAGLHLGRHHELVSPLTALAAEQPLRENLHRTLMLALHRSGRRADALAVFRRLRRSLVDELGVEPGAAVQRAYREMLADEGTPAAPAVPSGAPFQLPGEPEAFTGREAEAARIRELLLGEPDAEPSGGRRARVVVVSGMGGVGKTALAVHVAHRVRDAFPDGVLHADLRGYGVQGARTARELLARFLSDLGVHHDTLPDDADDRALLLRSALAGRRVLLVLDNARDAAHVAPLLPAGGPSAALVTSRQLLAELTGAVTVPLAPFPEEEQRALLAALCGADRVGREPEAAAAVLAACGGLPLALHIVGSRLASRPAWPLALLAGRLTPHRGRLEALAMGTVDVRHTFAMSYTAMRDSDRPLEREAARAFRLLGLWATHPLTPAATAALLGVPEARAAALLDVLADAHLVLNPEPDRYTLHDLLGEYAARCTEEEDPPEEREAAELRLLSWYVAALAASSLAATHETQPPPPLEPEPGPGWALPSFTDDDEAIRWAVRELPAVRQALARADALGRSDMAWRLAVGLFGYAGTHWWTGEWDACLAQAMETARAHGDELGRAWLHRRTAVAHGMAERNEECLAELRLSLELFTRRGDVLAQASILGNMSALYQQVGDARQSLLHAELSRDTYLRAGSAGGGTVRGEALVLSRIAYALRLNGELERSAADYRRVIELLRGRGHGVFLATTLTQYADVLRELGRRDGAFAALEEARDIRERMSDRAGTADCLVSLALAHHHFGEWAEARAAWEECLELARAHRLERRVEQCEAGLEELARDGR